MGRSRIKMALYEYKEMRKRGQISFFIIIGFVLLIVVGFVIYLAGFTTKEKSKREVITAQQIPRDIQEINNYVVGCLDKVTSDGLELIGKRGGIITISEGGISNPTVPGRDFVELGGEMVTYGIINVVNPFITMQGINILIPAEDIHRNLLGYVTDALVQDDLGRDGCLMGSKFNDIFEEKGFEIVSDPAEISLDLNISNEDVKVNLNYSLAITNKATGETRELKRFHVTKKVRLGMMHDFLTVLMDNEAIEEVSFDLFEDMTLPSFDTSFKIAHIIKDVYYNDDVIEVVDGGSFLKGQPYTFRFARMNRAPSAVFTYELLPVNMPPFANPRTISFSALSDPDEDVLGYAWLFDVPVLVPPEGLVVGDIDSTDQYTEHTYGLGTFHPELIVNEPISGFAEAYTPSELIIFT